MRFFSRKAFERLLFALHPSAYHELDQRFQTIEERHPGSLDSLCKMFELNFSSATTVGAIVPDGALKIELLPLPKGHDEQKASCNHLIVSLKSDSVHQRFIVPLPFVLKAFESRVCKPNTYQVYQHTLIEKRPHDTSHGGEQTITEYLSGARHYVGITSRTWQSRAMEHQYAARRGSMLLFHRALRGEMIKVKAHEHIVVRAGLSRTQALQIEEIEVEQRTLHGLHPEGLNMIPGGEAGLRFLSKMTKQPASHIKIDDIDGLLEAAVNNSLRQPGIKVKGAHTNAKLAALWRENIQFRIKAMTNAQCRMSYRQIRAARIWDAAGWSLEKIHEYINGMDGRQVSLEKLQRLLDGKSYETIPHLLIPVDEGDS